MANLQFKNKILSFALKTRLKKINFFKDNPHAVQDRVFKNLIKNGRETIFGLDHDFKNINSFADFSNKVPVRTYEEIFPYIERVRAGEKNILWNQQTKWFAKSSGTTNAKSKFIPMTIDSLKKSHYKAGKDMLALYLGNYPTKKFFEGNGLILGGSLQNRKNYTDGDLSAILLDNFPFWVNYHRSPKHSTALMHDWEEKLELIVSEVICQDITNLSGVPSWMLIILKKVLERTNSKNILEVWPNLELYMHGGINFSPYKKQYENIIPSKQMNYFEIYNASEGIFGLQDKPNSNEMLLMLDHGIFYEFIKHGDTNNNNNPKYYQLGEVEMNQDYSLVITTNGGLWRYLIGDLISFTSLSPYRIKVSGRIKNYLNVFGEELITNNTDKALEIACKKTESNINEYTVCPIFLDNNSGGHQWLVEFENHPKDTEKFISILDEELKKNNSDYEAKRSYNLVIQKPVLTSLAKGTFYRWLKQNNRLGGQYKIPRLNNDRKIADNLINLNN